MEVLGVHLTVWNCLVALVVICASYTIYGWLMMLAWRKKYNLKGPLPLPIVGNFLRLLGKNPEIREQKDIQTFGQVYALSTGFVNIINIHDFDLVKKIFIREHLQFQNRFSVEFLDPRPLNVSLLSLRDSEWKRVRNIVTPTFSPVKIKLMIEEVNFCADLLIKSLIKPATSGEPIDIHHNCGCFSMDVIAGTAFGIRTCAYTNPDQPFVQHAKKVFGPEAYKNPMLLIAMFFPNFAKILKNVFGVSFFYPPDSVAFFCDVIERVVEDRKKTQQTSRADMIGLMMSAQENEERDAESNKKLSKDELLALGFIAFVAGYDTTSSLLTYFAYAMATHPEIQERLVEEINTKFPSDDEVHVKYDDIADLPYLDQVISETLRMYPPLIRMNRTTSLYKDVLLDGHWFPANTMLQYSIWHFHHDPKLFEDPECFNPERFSPEEKQKRDPVSFMSFGHGPRNCIGMRLALLEAKVAAIHLMKRMKFIKINETEEPLELSIMEGFLRPKRPIKLGATLRKTEL